MILKKITQISIFITLILFTLNSCSNPGDARKTSPNPKDRLFYRVFDGIWVSDRTDLKTSEIVKILTLPPLFSESNL